MKHNYKLFVSVNGEEYYSEVRFMANDVRLMEPQISEGKYPMFPIAIDGVVILFDEEICEIWEDDELIYKE